LTQAFGWRSIFYVNIVPGLAVTVLTLLLVRVDTPRPSMLRRIDYTHLAAMAAFLGGIEYVLEEGPRNDWLDDPDIARAAWLALVGFVVFMERSLRSETPIVRLSPFRKPNFVFACVFNLVIGFGLYSATYLVPVYLGRVRGYDSLQIGTTVFVTGIAQLASTVIAARLSRRADPRAVIVVGLPLFALSLWSTSFMTPEWGFDALLVPQLLRGFAIMLCIVPSVTLALDGFSGPELRYASGQFNLMRNLGGAIGIAVVNTWLQDQTRIHVARFGEALGEPTRHAPEFIATLSQRIISSLTSDSAHATLVARGEIARVVGRAALTLAFNEVFRLMAWIFLVALLLVPLCRPMRPSGAPSDAH
jgi:DHA2 family multidrug resistance protein